MKIKFKWTFPNLMGLATIMIGFIIFGINVYQHFKWNKTTATIIEFKEKEDEHQFIPILEFEGQFGEFRIEPALMSSNKWRYKVGDTIPIIYSDDPSVRPKIHTFNWVFWPLIFPILGFIMILLPSDAVYVS